MNEAISIIPYESGKHLSLIKDWWLARQGLDVPSELLSESGFVAVLNEEPVAAVFIYPTIGSKVMMFGWPIARPDSEKEARGKAIDFLFDEIRAEAKRQEYKLLWTVSGVEPVQTRLIKHGFVIGDQQINQYWGEVK